MLNKYYNYLTSLKGYSENTAQSYLKDIRDFQNWLKTHRSTPRWSTVTRTDLDDYITELVMAGRKPATTNRRLASIASLYRWFKREGLEVENPAQYESRRKIAETIPNTIPEHDLIKAYDNANGIAKVALGLFITTGIRIQELLDLRFEDIDFNLNSIKVRGKGNKERMVYTTADKLELLHQLSFVNQQHERIFIMNQRTLRTIIWNALRPYSSAVQLSPHAIRHTFATHAANKGVNVTTLAQAMGHKNIETTQKYINMAKAPVQAIMTTYNIFN